VIWTIRSINDEILHEVEAETFLEAVEKKYTNLCDANLRDADLRGANLRGADLYGSDLYGANLSGANLSDLLTNNSVKWWCTMLNHAVLKRWMNGR